jgi:hypothetical protein
MASKTEPTHILRLEIALNLESNPAAESYDIQGALAEAVDVTLPLVRLGTLGLLCGDVNVTLEERNDQ